MLKITCDIIAYSSDSQTVRRGALVRRDVFSGAPRRRRNLPGLKINFNSMTVARVMRQNRLL